MVKKVNSAMILYGTTKTDKRITNPLESHDN